MTINLTVTNVGSLVTTLDLRTILFDPQVGQWHNNSVPPFNQAAVATDACIVNPIFVLDSYPPSGWRSKTTPNRIRGGWIRYLLGSIVQFEQPIEYAVSRLRPIGYYAALAKLEYETLPDGSGQPLPPPNVDCPIPQFTSSAFGGGSVFVNGLIADNLVVELPFSSTGRFLFWWTKQYGAINSFYTGYFN